MKIFVLHYSKLTDRKAYIVEHFKQQNLHCEFVERFDKEEITDTEMSRFQIYNNKPGYDNKAGISLFLKHTFVFQEIMDKYDSAIIFEDDVILCDNFMEKLNQYMAELPDDYDMLYIGDGCQMHIPSSKLEPNKHVYIRNHGECASRCTDSYVVSKKGAKKMCDYIQTINYKINEPIDWWLNRASRETVCKVYWAEPTIVTQGSKNGTFTSSIDLSTTTAATTTTTNTQRKIKMILTYNRFKPMKNS